MEKILVDEDGFNEIASQKNVPSFLGKGKKEVVNIAKKNKIKINLKGNGYVKRQIPEPGEEISHLDEVEVFLEPGI